MPDLPQPKTIVIDTDVGQGSDTKAINYFEEDYIGVIMPERPNEQQQLLDPLTIIGSTPSPPREGDKTIT